MHRALKNNYVFSNRIYEMYHLWRGEERIKTHATRPPDSPLRWETFARLPPRALGMKNKSLSTVSSVVCVIRRESAEGKEEL